MVWFKLKLNIGGISFLVTGLVALRGKKMVKKYRKFKIYFLALYYDINAIEDLFRAIGVSKLE